VTVMMKIGNLGSGLAASLVPGP